MVTVNTAHIALLEEYVEWQAEQKYKDTSAEAFVQEYERDRLARNAEAVLLFLEDIRKENDLPAEGVANTVQYLLNAEKGDPEVEEWFPKEKPAPLLEGYVAQEGYLGDPDQAYNWAGSGDPDGGLL